MKDDLYTLLKKKGYKITNQRKAIINAFLHSEKHLLTAAEVHNTVKINNEDVNFSTIYRNLEMLLEIGILNRVNLDNGINSYELNIDSHHHHLICLKCGEAEMIAYCPMEEINSNIRKLSKFTPIDHKLEIYGHCDKCK
ncbi:Fur family transcriptional regulator, zinc uptake regulator [Natronincola peptidivorans]|uniref:Fur family transcriptional regulator, zinc uptake regulator n=1 Tax=Natronincola peptidivorans TaxID=426128 RepID=A0A1H9YXR2_9FIRM|nr:Fur family transcriptional regulator [Natronincola peptidivorans]SES73997.1 Fur family transcriptional regulator, zinc uptake regulator [Natronincola peptidivorans]